MRLIDETLILQNLECLQKSPWYNDGKDPESGRRCQFNIRKEAAEIVRDLCIRPVPTVDAIPVEWLENKMNTLCFEAMGAGALYGDRIGELAKSINEVMKLWQKEQEARQWPLRR